MWTADTQYIWEWSSYLSSNCRHDTALSGDQWLKLPAAGCDGELYALSSTLNCHQQSQGPQVLPEDNNTWSIPDRNAPLSFCSCLVKQILSQSASSKNGENSTGDHRKQDQFFLHAHFPINLRGHTPKDGEKKFPRRCQIQLTRSNLRMIFLSMFQHGLSRWVAFATKWALKGTTFVVHYIHMPYVVSTHCECLVA